MISQNQRPTKSPANVQFPDLGSELEKLFTADQQSCQATSVVRANTERLKEIIDQIGRVWPTVSRVGIMGSQGAWLVAQHSNHDVEFQKLALGLMKMCMPGEVRLDHVALLIDRIRKLENLPQIYGSQGEPKDGTWQLHPVEDIEHVDERRILVGLEPLKEYIDSNNKLLKNCEIP